MSFSVFYYASLAPKEDSYSGFVPRLYYTSTRMSVSFWNELTQ